MVAAIESFRELQEKVEHELAMSEPPAPTVLIQFSRDATLYSIPSDPERRGWLSVETFPLPVPPADERRPGIIPVIFPGLKRSYWRAMIPHRSGLGLTYIALGRTSERGLDDDLVLDFRTAAVYQEPARKSKKRGR